MRSLLRGTRARTTVDTAGVAFDGLLSAAVSGQITGAPSAHDTWRGLDLDARTLDRMSPQRLLDLLSDLSPEVSSAVWAWLRFGNGGWEAVASRPSGAAAGRGAHQAALDAFLDQLTDHYGAVDVVINRLLLGAYLRGAVFAELVLDARGRRAIDLATPDPGSARFRRRRDPERGAVWQLGQWQDGQFVTLDRPTIRYVPIDPLPASPEGRAPAQPGLFPAVFLLAMLHDLRRVVQQQGYPRIDLAIDWERLTAMIPADLDNDPAKVQAWIGGTIREIQAAYSMLEPDDAYVHLDVVSVNRPVGTIDASSLGAVDQIIAPLERMLVRGLKVVPILLGMTDGVSEANVRIQWKLYRASVRALQHLLEQTLEYLLTLALEAQGIAAMVTFRFAETDLLDRLIDTQTDEIAIRNARERYRAGWISHDAAAQEGAGVEKANVPEPRDGGRAPTPAAPVGEEDGAQ